MLCGRAAESRREFHETSVGRHWERYPVIVHGLQRSSALALGNGLADTRDVDDETPIGPPWANPHDRLDEIRRRTHIAIAAKIDADGDLLEVPRRNIRRWAEQMGRMPRAYGEWLEALDRPWPEIRQILVSPDENSVRMRQSTPFSGIGA